MSPNYHIQASADESHNSFPYFHHHDSVAKLWNDKWRPLCEKAVYPFGEGNIVDFAPIFDALVKASPDGCGILSVSDDYTRAFLPKAEELIAKAKQMERDGNSDAARDFYQRAATVYRISRFAIPRTPLGKQSWERGRDAYLKGAKYVHPTPKPVAIPFTAAQGDLGDTVHAILTFPDSPRSASGWPLLLMITGLDGYHTDMQGRVFAHAEHGFASLVFGIPGTGDCPAAANDPQSWDRLMKSVIGWPL